MEPARRAFYEYHAALMEPWDGPAAIAFTDGRQIGATLDRNGLRPARFIVTDDDHVILASESGVLPIPEEKIVRKWRLQPGKMLLIDLEQGRIIEDEEVKAAIAGKHPYEDWLHEMQFKLSELPLPEHDPEQVLLGQNSNASLLDRQQAFGYTQEDVQFFLEPMAQHGDDPLGSMGADTPIAVLSRKPKLLYNYFKQNFAQVTNPPIDPIREELVMSLVSMIGPRPNLLGLAAGTHKRLEISQPVLTNGDLDKIRSISELLDGAFRTATIDITWDASEGAAGLKAAIERIRLEATEHVLQDINILILSDRAVSADRIPVPALLALSAVHHKLIRQGLRMQVGLVVETGEAREVHHFCTLAGYGAEAVNPYLAFETLEQIRQQEGMKLSAKDVKKNYIKAIGKGVLKVMSKMGISTYQSYCGAQIFDGVGLSSELIAEYFTGTATTIEGVGLDEIGEEAVRRHAAAFGDYPSIATCSMSAATMPTAFAARTMRGRRSPSSKLQHAVRGNVSEDYAAFAQTINEQNERLLTIRGLMQFKFAATPVPIEEVEPAAEIVKRFATGAMSFGSISREAHTTLAIAMNRIGGRSNTGEGGEEADRFVPMKNGDSMRSRIKQVASGRFGVTAEYLVNADDIQIKMAQGAKPGEGGQLPGHKVDKNIAKVRHSTPGVGLISPPPHHDIYSIEDLAQLIHDLKNVNPVARISVKLVSEVGVGTVAAGVSKARADHVTISGFEGGTGASPLTSLTHAGSPVGDRPRRDAADAGAERVARTDCGAGRRRPAHGPGRRDRRAAGRGRVRLLDSAADFGRLHHDAQMPSQHLPRRRRDAGPDPARALHRRAGARDQLLLLRRRRTAPDHGPARLPQAGGHDRPRRPARHEAGGRSLEGQGRRPVEDPLPDAGQKRRRGEAGGEAGPRPRRRARSQADQGGEAGARASRPSRCRSPTRSRT